jgi:hypothetical protein
MFKEVVAVYSENYAKPVNTLGKTQRVLNVKVGGTYRCHWVLKG